MSENKTKLGRESAFPVVETEYNGIHQAFENNCTEAGISKRFYAACQIAPQIISASLTDSKVRDSINHVMEKNNLSAVNVVTGLIYEYVDELLRQENA